MLIKENAVNKSHITLFGTPASGHCHRVLQVLALLGLDYDYVAAPAPVRQSAEFLAMNPLGQIPVLKDGDLVLCDSNAIMVYLVQRYAHERGLLPSEPVAAAEVQRWLSIAAGELKYGPAAARVALLFGRASEQPAAAAIAARLFPFMDAHLGSRSYLAADRFTLADLACYAYVAVAPEGGVSLEPYPQLRAWVARLEALPGFKAMPRAA